MIDQIRFFAAAAVAFFHFNQPIAPVGNWYRHLVNYGWIGVPVFFIISGYCIMASADHSAGSVQFLIKRFFRVFPAYWISLVIVALSAIFEKLYTGYNSVPCLPATFVQLLANLTLTTAPLTRIKTSNWVYWTLTYEICFYIVIAFVLLFKRGPGRIVLLVITAISAIPATADYLFFLDNWMVFCTGIWIFYLFGYQSRGKGLYLSIFLALIVCSIITHKQFNSIYLGAAISTAVMLIFSHYYRFHNNFFSRLGEYSYSIYLIHVPVGIFIMGDFKNAYVQRHMLVNLAYDILTFVLVCFLSWLLFRWVELPGQEMGKKISRKLWHRAPGAADIIGLDTKDN